MPLVPLLLLLVLPDCLVAGPLHTAEGTLLFVLSYEWLYRSKRAQGKRA